MDKDLAKELKELHDFFSFEKSSDEHRIKGLRVIEALYAILDLDEKDLPRRIEEYNYKEGFKAGHEYGLAQVNVRAQRVICR